MSKPATSTSKDVIYIDVDDEITAIIEKVTSSAHKIVALVLPKRSTTLQSVVNMKLLQKSAVASKKNLVLITTDVNLLPLAGAVGMHVAKTPQSKPYIPKAVTETDDGQEQVNVDDTDDTDFDSAAHAAVAIGALAATQKGEEEPIELDNSTPEPTKDASKDSKKDKKTKNANTKVPNFTRFRKWLIIGGVALAVLIAGAVYAFITLPAATVTIATDTKDISNTLDVLFDTTATTVSADPAVVPSVVEKVEKTNSVTVPATGQRNDGLKATGSVVMTKNVCSPPLSAPSDIPAGTGVSTAGKNYVTTEKATFSYNGSSSGCFVFKSQQVDIVAVTGGASYNVDSATFTVAGSSAVATGSVTGGTDDVKNIVTQADIDNATKTLEAKVDDTTKAELTKRLETKNLVVIEESLAVTNAAVTSNVPAGTEAAEVTVIRKTTTTMIGAKQADLDSLVTQTVNKQIDTTKQKVLATGVDKAAYQLQNQQEDSAKSLISMDVTSTVGPDLNDQEIKDAVAGMKAAEAEALVGSYPGVTSVEVTYGPFWVSAIPDDTEKITIVYEK